jgi:hypothetical protein
LEEVEESVSVSTVVLAVLLKQLSLEQSEWKEGEEGSDSLPRLLAVSSTLAALWR